MFVNRLNLFIQSLYKLIKRFPNSLIIGFMIGLICGLVFNESSMFFFGVILGALLEKFLDFILNIRSEWEITDSINKLLGSIAKNEEYCLYFSPFFRDLTKIDEFKLLLLNPNTTSATTEVIGPEYVLGDGDALALALILSLLSKAKVKPNKISIERGDLTNKKWGVNIFCLGAHNLSTREVLASFNNKYFIFDNNYSVITKPDDPVIIGDQGNSKARKGVYISHQTETAGSIDYGIILKLKNQFQSENKFVFIIAGIEAAGTSGAAYYMLTHFDELSKLGDEFGVLIKVPCGYQSAVRVDFESVAQFYDRI
jgi:hypothetical protein